MMTITIIILTVYDDSYILGVGTARLHGQQPLRHLLVSLAVGAKRVTEACPGFDKQCAHIPPTTL